MGVKLYKREVAAQKLLIFRDKPFCLFIGYFWGVDENVDLSAVGYGGEKRVSFLRLPRNADTILRLCCVGWYCVWFDGAFLL